MNRRAFRSTDFRIMESACRKMRPYYGGNWADSSGNRCPAYELSYATPGSNVFLRAQVIFDAMCLAVFEYMGKPPVEAPQESINDKGALWRSRSSHPEVRFFQNLLHTNPLAVADIFARMAAIAEEHEEGEPQEPQAALEEAVALA